MQDNQQRMILLDIILGEECSSSRRFIIRRPSRTVGIGSATVYRMVNTLEDMRSHQP